MQMHSCKKSWKGKCMPDARREPYAGYGRNPYRGTAYEHYLRTGEICDVWGVYHNRGVGAPTEPMDETTFYARIQKFPKPASHVVEDMDFLPDVEIRAILRNAEMTQTACREGWIVGLYDHVQRKRRLPNRKEIGSLKHAAAFLLRCASGQESMGQFHASLRKLAEAMLDRRNQLIREFAR